MSVDLPFKPEKAAIKPTATRGFDNGKIPPEHLALCGIRKLVMVRPAADAMRAMVTAAAHDGVDLSASSTMRTYDQQVDLFLQRFTTTPHPGRRMKQWKGVDYWLKPGMAMAATPGTSNHGRGLAADLSERDWKTPLSERALRWLAQHGPGFGFWNTVESEAWHWCYCLGDDVPEAVGPVEPGPVTGDDAIAWSAIRDADAAFGSTMYAHVLRVGSSGHAVAAVQWKLAAAGFDVTVDGDFGPATESVVRAFQSANGLEVDGLVGPVTWRALGLPGAGGGPVPAPEPGTDRATSDVTYQVRAGDAFIRIARRTLWDGSLEAATSIAEHNDLDVDTPIHPGQILVIPGCRAVTVVANDGWKSVAARLGRKKSEIKDANAWQGDALHPGMVIYGGRVDQPADEIA